MVIDQKKICPLGWHIPSLSEWSMMFDFIGGFGSSKEKLISQDLWSKVGFYYGNNLSGLNVLPAGLAGYNSAGGLGWIALMWTSSEILPKVMFSKGNSILISTESPNMSIVQYDNFTGASIRCIKD